MQGSPLEADETGVKHISQCSALKVIDFSVMNAVTLPCVTNNMNRKKFHKKTKMYHLRQKLG
jgi:hypothetical protein